MFNAMLLFWLQTSSVCPAYQISSLWYFPPSFFARVWIHPSVSSLVRFSSMWEKEVIFLNILATGTSFSGNRCVIPINICIFSSCLLNSSHPNQHTCQARTCCNVCCKETTLGKLGLHRTCLSDEDTSTVPAVKQFFTGNIKLQAIYRLWTKFV